MDAGIRAALEADPMVDITTHGRKSGDSRRIEMPLLRNSPNAATVRSSNAQASSLSLSILLVDDHRIVREGLRTLLTNASADAVQVREAENGRLAIAEAAKFIPDVVVMDLAMPNMDGWEAIRQLHQSSWTSAIPVVAVSAVADGREAAFEVGCDAYLTKPCAPQVLWAQIQALLTPPDARPAYKSRPAYK